MAPPRAIVQHLGLAAGVPAAAPRYARTDGSVATLAAGPTVVDSDGPPDWGRDPVVVSLARWDGIKDPLGILDGFVERVVPATGAHLLLAGPDPGQVADDPEAEAVLAGVRERWRRLPPRARARVHLACLPLTPLEDSEAMVNAIQRLAAVVVKKSVQEGFGLGVTEAMWKARPVVASAVGGHLDQVQHRHSGLLVDDPADVAAFGDAIVELLRDPPLAARLGQAGRERARALFLNDRHFVRWIGVFASALEQGAGATRSLGPAAEVPAQPSPDAAALDLDERDALTGLWNRRRFENELGRARENAERLALLSIDVDRYREVIRQYGTAAAQGVIQSIALVLAERLRPNDTLARMGGDEFAAIVPAATPRSSRAWPTGSAPPCAGSHTPPAPAAFLPPSASAPRSSTRARRRTTKRCAPPTPPCTRPRSQAATAPSCTSPDPTKSQDVTWITLNQRHVLIPAYPVATRWTAAASCAVSASMMMFRRSSTYRWQVPGPGQACRWPVCGVSWVVSGPVPGPGAALSPVPADAFLFAVKEAAGERWHDAAGGAARSWPGIAVLNGR